ncbi:unnamed protein product, partial [Prorocentrum cordatum]
VWRRGHCLARRDAHPNVQPGEPCRVWRRGHCLARRDATPTSQGTLPSLATWPLPRPARRPPQRPARGTLPIWRRGHCVARRDAHPNVQPGEPCRVWRRGHCVARRDAHPNVQPGEPCRVWRRGHCLARRDAHPNSGDVATASPGATPTPTSSQGNPAESGDGATASPGATPTPTSSQGNPAESGDGGNPAESGDGATASPGATPTPTSSQGNPAESGDVATATSAESVDVAAAQPGPTPSPTASQEFSAESVDMSSVHAVGDPHLVNVYGQHFDIFHQGVHVLLQVPRGAAPAAARLYVAARAQQLGAVCDEMYFTSLNVTGRWVEDRLRSKAFNLTDDFPEAAMRARGRPTGGLHFLAGQAGNRRHTPWMYFGGVGLRVTWGHTAHGVKYLNVLMKHVSQAGAPVGGLLGGDDHTEAATRSSACSKSLALRAEEQDEPQGAEPGSHTDWAHMAVATW